MSQFARQDCNIVKDVCFILDSDLFKRSNLIPLFSSISMKSLALIFQPGVSAIPGVSSIPAPILQVR